MRLFDTGYGSRNSQEMAVCPKCKSTNLRLDSSRMYFLCKCGAVLSRKAIVRVKGVYL